jgi:Rad3-related DNA helicase
MRYSEREKIDINYLANLATKYIDKDGGNLVVTVNKRYADEISKILTSKGYKMLSKEDIIAKRYMAPGSIAVDVAGGSLTEGINILGLTRVIVLGALYPSPSPELDIAGKVVGSIYEKIAILRTAQAVGRIRGRGSAVLIDQRFKELRNTMPKWIDIIN